ncbi:glycoside hydrolase family 3 N-terminal domain-containing protein [Chitinophaga rhizophila]|uniref:beta-N-acetylhexosaminidase n=1 Tax=Chitinophaga rhizophila TaxID=2866212 RepID=A0ABS7GHC9_9BACT|nr:glycoside hydrolase family 3 N-terminal domain-containing protein [Chitinophaga rhizophila]MBW8686189.1 serine hydrolase [Chitinophaga rhizophila]
MMKQLTILGLSFLCLGGSVLMAIPDKGPGPRPPKQQAPQEVKEHLSAGKKVKFRQQDTASHWVDSVFESLDDNERIAQLIMIRAHSNLGADHIRKVVKDIRDNKVGGLIFFQGGPVRQANLTNYYQSISKTPLMIAIDGEWGLGMRLDSITSLPRNLMLGAVQDSSLAYEYGKHLAMQCRRLGIHVDYAPDMDVNNNPNNPVINDRSFGQDKYQVARLGVQVIKGMQDQNVMAVAKHFPGHGDTDVDSHYDMPVIRKTRAQLDSLELYPFRKAIEAGVQSIMMAHLYIPALDSTPNTPTSISRKAITDFLKGELGYKGIVITDALEMKGIAKFYTGGEEAARSLLAGNDMMMLPSTASGSIEAIKRAIKRGDITWDEVNARVKKVLLAKYKLGLNKPQFIDVNNLTADLNAGTDSLTRRIAQQAITLIKNDNNLIPFTRYTPGKVAVIAVGADVNNAFVQTVKSLRPDVNSFIFTARQAETQVPQVVERLKKDYQAVIISLHNYSRRPARNFNISSAERLLIQQLQQEMPSATVVFGNPYAIQYFCDGPTILAAYEDDEITQRTAASILFGQMPAKGKLPVTVCTSFPYGTGIVSTPPPPVEVVKEALQHVKPESVGMNSQTLRKIDVLANEMIRKGAAPGCQILAMKDGKIVYDKTFGYFDYSKREPVTSSAVYDLASVTKICATTVAIMRLYDEGKLSLDAKLGDYLPWVKGTNKEGLKIRDILLHQAGLVAFIPFYRDVVDAKGFADTALFHAYADSVYSVRVAEHLYMKSCYVDTMYMRILESTLKPQQGYVYSDNDFIFLGKIVEQLSGKKLNRYVRETFYEPLGMTTTRFRPREHFQLSQLAPTEHEPIFRRQWIRGDVHDPGAAMFGGVAGHAGLFSNAEDLAILMQMLLNGGTFGGKEYIKAETLRLFTANNSNISRRGLGFDKPEKTNSKRGEGYPAKSASQATYGHTGFTGTCAWVDPQSQLVYIFLSNRVCPAGGENKKLITQHVRENIMEVLYEAMGDRK